VRVQRGLGDGATAVQGIEDRDTVGTAFDLLELDGEDLRVVLSDRTDDDGATIFRQECRMGLECIVSKRLTAPYRSGPSRDWLKVKNPDSPAMIRALEAEW
jgi:ATP-dependent DNA ligase